MAPEDTKNNHALASNDPYNNMDRQDTHPDFRPANIPANQNNPAAQAKNRLASAEQSAAASPASTTNGGVDQAKSTEQNQTFNPRFTGKGLPNEKNEPSKKKSFLKRRGPLLAIMTLLIGGGGMMAGSQTLMPFATEIRIIDEFNSMKTVMSKRSDILLRYQVESDRYHYPTRKTIFHNEKFRLSDKQITKLKTEGIDFAEVELSNGRKVKLLVYDDGTGVKQPILTETDMKHIDAGNINLDELKAKTNAALKGNTDAPDLEFKTSVMNVSEAFEIDDFRNGYLKQSKTWKGNFAGWFDSLVLKIFDRVGISRSRFKKWKTASDIEAGNAAFKQAAENQKNLIDNDSEVTKKGDVDTGEKNPDGSARIDPDGDVPVTTDPDGGALTSDALLGKNKTLGQIQDALNSKVKKVAQAATTITCAAFAVAGAIHAIVAAQQATEMLNLVTGFLESVQKVQSGDGDGSPMAYYLKALTAPDKTGKSGMAAQGIGALFGRKGIDPNNESVKKANSESLLSDIKIMEQDVKFEFTIRKFEECAYARAVMGGVDFVIDVLGFVTGGLASLVKGLFKAAAWSVGIGIVVQVNR